MESQKFNLEKSESENTTAGNLKEAKSSIDSQNDLDSIGGISGSGSTSSRSSAYVNPWARSAADWYVIESPLDQGRIVATYGPPLAPKILQRVKALKKLAKEHCAIEKQLYGEVYALERKYNRLQDPLYKQRARIVEEGEEGEEGSDVEGIPHFWVTCLRNCLFVSGVIELWDEPILDCLKDIQCKFTDTSIGLDFIFASNDYFTNRILRVSSTMEYRADAGSVGGCFPNNYKGTKINWKPNKCVTLLDKNEPKIIIPSFFQMFEMGYLTHGSDHSHEPELLALQFIYQQVFITIFNEVVPKAVLYFTKEAGNINKFEFGA